MAIRDLLIKQIILASFDSSILPILATESDYSTIFDEIRERFAIEASMQKELPDREALLKT